MSIGGIRSEGIQFDPTAEASPNQTVRDVQQALNRLPGEANLREDGVFDARTSQALRQFQHTAGLEVSGAINHPTVDALNRAAPAPTAAQASAPLMEHAAEKAIGGEGLRHDYVLQGTLTRSRLDLQPDASPNLEAKGFTFDPLEKAARKDLPICDGSSKRPASHLDDVSGKVFPELEARDKFFDAARAATVTHDPGAGEAAHSEGQAGPETAGVWAGKFIQEEVIGGMGNTFRTEAKIDHSPPKPPKNPPKGRLLADGLNQWIGKAGLAGEGAGVWAGKFQAEAAGGVETGWIDKSTQAWKGAGVREEEIQAGRVSGGSDSCDMSITGGGGSPGIDPNKIQGGTSPKGDPKSTPGSEALSGLRDQADLAGPGGAIWAQKFRAEAAAGGEGGISATDPHSEKGPPKFQQAELAGLGQQYEKWAPQAGADQGIKEWVGLSDVAAPGKHYDVKGLNGMLQQKTDILDQGAITPDQMGAERLRK